MKQVPPSPETCLLWGRIVRGYRGAVGNGSLGDSDAFELLANGSMWMTLPIDRQKFDDAYQISHFKNGPSTLGGETLASDSVAASIRCTLMSRGSFRRPAFLALLKLTSGANKYRYTREAVAGFLCSQSLPEIFRQFDLWLEGNFPPALAADAALELGGKN